MSDSKYSNFDYDLSQKILTLLKVRKKRFFADIQTKEKVRFRRTREKMEPSTLKWEEKKYNS